jgi:hypothetical protein
LKPSEEKLLVATVIGISFSLVGCRSRNTIPQILILKQLGKFGRGKVIVRGTADEVPMQPRMRT